MAAARTGVASGDVARIVIISLVLVAMAWLLWSARDLLFILFFGVLVALFLSVFVDRLVAWGVPRVLSVLLVLVVLGGLITGAVVVLWPTVRDQLAVVAGEVPDAAARAGDWIQQQYQDITGAVGVPPEEAQGELRARLRGQARTLIGGALPILNSALGALAGVLIVLMAGIYMTVDPELYRHGVRRLLPPRHREPVAEAMSRSAHTLRWWMIGTLINMVLVATLVGLGLWFLGVPAVLALAVIAGLLEFVPIFGPIIAALPAMAVALTVSPITALWVALLYTIVQQLEGNVITPLVMRGVVELPPALTLLFLSFMGIIFGFLGLLLAVPILAGGTVMVQALYIEPMEERAGAEGDAEADPAG